MRPSFLVRLGAMQQLCVCLQRFRTDAQAQARCTAAVRVICVRFGSTMNMYGDAVTRACFC